MLLARAGCAALVVVGGHFGAGRGSAAGWRVWAWWRARVWDEVRLGGRDAGGGVGEGRFGEDYGYEQDESWFGLGWGVVSHGAEMAGWI